MAFISKLIIDIEGFLKNDLVGQAYIEEFGAYKGFSRIVIKKFRIYYKKTKIILVSWQYYFLEKNENVDELKLLLHQLFSRVVDSTDKCYF